MTDLNNETTARLNQVYRQLDRKFEEEETQKLAVKNQLPYINLFGYPLESATLELVPQERAEQLGAAVFYREGRTAKMAVLEPSEAVTQLVKELAKKNYQTQVFQVSRSSFQHLMTGYGKMKAVEHHAEGINIKSADVARGLTLIQELSGKINQTSATEIMDSLVGAALSIDSSDIHIEPEASRIKVRYRIDGVLQDGAELPKELHHVIVSRIKILGKLKLNITTVPQDGSFRLTYNDQPVDIRVSVLPSAYGESIVMRLLRQDQKQIRFEDLGIAGLSQQRLLRELEKPNGMILVTGPTGSGKTTTLYAILDKLNEPGTKIITLEDPVEYRIEGITQTPIDTAAGMTFGTGLRAILRQDPDVIMVGEMRDLETAETAAQAALTGHIVLSTLHTNDAPSAIPRMIDLGVKPFTLAPAINAVVAQRLVRRICEVCKTEEVLEESTKQRVKLLLDAIPKTAQITVPRELKFYHSPGCDACHHLGYKGRMGVYEIFPVDEAIERLIHEQVTTSDIRKKAIEEGMVTMAQDGILKALNGLTDISEVFRVTEA